MPLFLSPVCNDQTFDANGDPLNAGQVETYLAGSSTPAATYTDDTGGTPQSNPIILNSLGYPTLGPIWLTGGQAYKFIIKDALGVTLRTIDDISGVNDASVSQSEWVNSGFTPTFIGATSFSVPGDQTAVLQVNRRLRTTNTSGFIYSTITNSSFAAGVTTVTVVNDSGSLDSGLTTVEYGVLSATSSSVPAIGVTRFTMTGRRLLGRDASATGSVEELTTAEAALMQPDRIQPITASVGSNALTITVNPTTLDFRSATLGSGAVTTRELTAAASLTISSGSTLGTTSGQLSRIAVILMDNAGTLEVAAVNMDGTFTLDEATLLSTTAEGGAGAADSANVVYSTTARSNLPWRLVGYLESTQATAGTWATAPSLIQGNGGKPVQVEKATQIQLGTAVTLTTQTSVDFTGIPNWADRVTLKGSGVSTNGTTGFGVQLGDSGGVENAGYTGASALQINAAGAQQVGNATTFAGATASAAANLYYVKFTIERITGNTWHIEGSASTSNVATLWSFNYTKTLSDVLDRVRFTTGNGVEQFDAGTVNISWE